MTEGGAGVTEGGCRNGETAEMVEGSRVVQKVESDEWRRGLRVRMGVAK